MPKKTQTFIKEPIEGFNPQPRGLLLSLKKLKAKNGTKSVE
jgi:hypothetical protein